MTADWRTELQLDIISDEDKGNLIKWMAYIKQLKAMSFSKIIDEASFDNIIWPVKP
ncbi:tail fiber assembly protein [Enterobacter roggenkampii]|uniref:tail fiber assembly protein n=1 Tax=Enterobacter roggenkampii TaxID=1812935 RepID=UPI0025829B1A|nr:tail fiber assembly protein [Enterobacter roggenkampii]